MTGRRAPRPHLLSVGQQALWLAQQLQPDSQALNVVLAVRVHGGLRPQPLQRALTALVQRHELLRTRFTTDPDGSPIGEPIEPRAMRLQVRPAEGLDDDTLFALAHQVGQEPLRLDEEGAFRAVVLRRGARDAVLVLVTHHLASDAYSQCLLLRDLLDGYRAETTGEPAPVRPLPRLWAEQVDAERQVLDSPRGAESRAYWREVCTGVPVASLPADPALLDGPGRCPSRGATIALPLSSAVKDRLAERAAEARVTPAAWLLAVFQAVLHRSGSGAEFLIGVPVTTRRSPLARESVGYFINTVPLRGRFTPTTTFAETVRESARQLLGGLRHLDCPVELPGRSAAFNILITLVVADRLPIPGLADGITEYAGLRLELYDVPQQEGRSELAVEIIQRAAGITVLLRYDTTRFEVSSVERFARIYRCLLDASFDDPQAQVARVPLAGTADRSFLLALGGGR
ncbi:condensation domain-containing protein [Kitasatospora sp. NPDC056651]|uniref:condensation domain-containing protein n=1 Tax=Kitasatospora sp. NPDC056651 TaxID=3345892 RepID=UPI0036B27B52